MTNRILLLNYEFPPLGGGASPASFQLAQELIKKYHYQIDVVTMGYADLPKIEKKDNGLTIYRVPCLRLKKEMCSPLEQFTYLCSAYFFCQKLFQQYKYDFCHAHFLIPTGILGWIFSYQHQLPYIVTSHGSDVPGFNLDRFKLLHLLTPPLLRKIVRRAQKIIAPSKYLKNAILKNISASLDTKTLVIPNGFDTSIFLSKNNQLTTKKEPYILSSGRLLPRKGFQFLIKAISTQHIGMPVHLVGDGPYRTQLEELAKTSATPVIFEGWLDNQSSEYHELIAKAAIFCFCSERENASIALLEAMTAGCAIVASNATGVAETVGDAGILLDPVNTSVLAKTLTELIHNHDLQKQLGKKAQQRVMKYFSLEKVAAQYHHLFQTLS